MILSETMQMGKKMQKGKVRYCGELKPRKEDAERLLTRLLKGGRLDYALFGSHGKERENKGNRGRKRRIQFADKVLKTGRRKE